MRPQILGTTSRHNDSNFTMASMLRGLLLLLVIVLVGLQLLVMSFSACQQETKAADDWLHPLPVVATAATDGLTSSMKSYAVVHIGPGKTGSSTIQANIREYSEQLKQDGYEMLHESLPRDTKERLVSLINPVQFVSCFLPLDSHERKEFECIPELLHSGLEIAKRKKKLFLSSEYFSLIKEEKGIEYLSVYLAHWDTVEIVVYYRRLYDWLQSNYNQFTKFRSLRKDDNWLWDKSIVWYFNRFIQQENITKGAQLFPIIWHLKRHFKVKLINFHDKNKDLSESFYCDAIPNMKHTCNAIQKKAKKLVTNESNDIIIYQDLVYAAMSAGLIEIESDGEMKAAALAIQKHQEQVLGLTKHDFKLTCLPNADLELLLNMSLEYEKVLMPEFFKSPLGELALRSDFEKQAKSKLCGVDSAATLKDPEWVHYFTKSLKQHIFVEYCNKYDDLQGAFCGGMNCTINTDAVLKCKQHWYTYGVKKGRALS